MCLATSFQNSAASCSFASTGSLAARQHVLCGVVNPLKVKSLIERLEIVLRSVSVRSVKTATF